MNKLKLSKNSFKKMNKQNKIHNKLIFQIIPMYKICNVTLYAVRTKLNNNILQWSTIK